MHSNILSSIRMALSTDNKCIKIDLIDKTLSSEQPDDDNRNVFASFLVPTESYQEIINAFVAMGKDVQATHNVDLGFKL